MVFDAILQYSRRASERLLGRDESSAAAPGFALQGRPGQVYNEIAFRHFLGLERRRAERSNRTFLLLMVSVKDPETRGHIPPAVATRLFSALSLCVREVDFLGWYREGQIAAAVLAQGPEPRDGSVQAVITERITSVLQERMPARVAEQLQVRVLQVRRRTTC